ncbi:MAG: hypothetical protein AB3N20_00235 [Rhizobiaceae bacterium]
MNSFDLVEKKTWLMLRSRGALKVLGQKQTKASAKASGSDYSKIDAQIPARIYGKVWANNLTNRTGLLEAQMAAG